MEKLFKRIKGI